MRIKQCIASLTVLVLVFMLTTITVPPQAQGLTTAGANKLVTTGPSGTGGNGYAFMPSVSADGSKVVFYSLATDLITGTTTTNYFNIFLYDVASATTRLVTTGGSGNGGNNSSLGVSISADGTKIAFSSSATDLIAGMTTTSNYNIFLYDVASATTQLITTGNTGTGGNSTSSNGFISADGSKLVFNSLSTNLVAGMPANGNSDIFLYDVASATTRLVTTGGSGNGGNGYSLSPSISADNSKVVFQSRATNLIAGTTTTSYNNIFLYDVASANTRLLTAGGAGNGGNNNSERPSVSADGSRIVFGSRATNLVASATTSGLSNVFLYDDSRATTTLVSTGATGIEGNSASQNPSISADGTKIVFDSYASDLVAGVTTRSTNIYLYDVASSAQKLVTAGASGTGNGGSSSYPSISADERRIVFQSTARNLVAGTTTTSTTNVFLYTITTYVDVTFDPANGSQPTTQTILQGNRVAQPDEPTYAGHVFAGWFSPAGNRWDFGSAITQDMTLTAHWTQLCTVTFDPQNGTPVFTEEVLSGDVVDRPAEPVRSGYTFDGWFTPMGVMWDFASPVTQDMTLTARWTQIAAGTFSVTFDPQNGEAVFTVEVPSGSKVSKPTDPVRENYSFDGWFTFDGKAWDFNNDITQSMTLTAHWTADQEKPSCCWLILLLLLLLVIIVIIIILVYRKKRKDKKDGENNPPSPEVENQE